MVRYLYITLFLFTTINCSAQGETWNWCFGDSAGVRFINGKNPVAVNTYKGWSYEGTSILNDSNGRVVLYSYSYYLYDSNNILQNEDFILKGGWSSCQPIQLIRHRKSNDVHIFTTSPVAGVSTDGFNHIIYNKGFKTKYKNIFKDIGEKQTSIFHQNGNDIWLMTHSLPNDTFYSFLVTQKGLIECPIINKIGATYTDENPTQGVLKFSPSGKYCANANWNLNRIELYKYDKENSRLYDLITIVQTFPYAIEYSPDEKYLYFNDRGTHIYQINLNQWNKDSIEKSRKIIATAKTNLYFQLQLGPDKKIYVALYGQGYIGRIENPNISDTLCDYQNNFLHLTGRTSEGGFPNFNASYFYTPSIDYAYEQDCRTNTIAFEGKDTFNATSYKWLFSKGTKTDTQTTKDASYSFADTGKWQVKYIAGNGARNDTVTKIIRIKPRLEQGFLGKDRSYCQTLPTLKAPKNLHCIHWYNDTMAELSRTDTVKISKSGTYYAKATNLSFCVEWDTIKVTKISPPKTDFTMADVCENDSAIFINKSQDASSYKWKFGDSKTSILENPKHIYNIGGVTRTFNVTLVALGLGCSDSISKQVTVNTNPVSDFSFTINKNMVDFKATQSGNTAYKWTFGNGDSATGNKDVSYTYPNIIGKYTACLKVINAAGCDAKTCKEVAITLGINSIIKADDISIYPNPSRGKITIKINKAGNYNLNIYSETGHLILEKRVNGNEANVVSLNSAKGNYIIEISDGMGNSAKRKLLVE